MKKKKFILIELEERNGEHEYRQHLLRVIGSKVKNIDKIADNEAKSFYPYATAKPKFEDGGYYHCGMTIHVKVVSVCEIKEAEYNVLNKYI